MFPYETEAELFVCNETLFEVSGELKWSLRNVKGEILEEGKENITVMPQSTVTIEEIDFNKTDVLNNYIEYSFAISGEIVSSGTALFTVSKHFNFVDPELSYEINGDKITVTSKAFAKAVCISSDEDIILSDNYFDLNSESKTVTILKGNAKNIKLTSVYDI